MSDKVNAAFKRALTEKSRPMKTLNGKQYSGLSTPSTLDKWRERFSEALSNPNVCFEYGDKESATYGRLRHYYTEKGCSPTATWVPIQRIVALLRNISAPEGRPGCGNRWCLNPAHFTTNPQKWAIREPVLDKGAVERLAYTPAELERLVQQPHIAEILDNPDLAKGRRIRVKAYMADGKVGVTKIMATRLIDYFREVANPSNGTD